MDSMSSLIKKNKWYLEIYCGDCNMETGMRRYGFEKYRNGIFVIRNYYRACVIKSAN